MKFLSGSLLLTFSLVACAIAPPAQEMMDARQAIRAAQEVRADQLAPESFRLAEQFMGEAARNLERRLYQEARHSALLAKEHAVTARARAVAVDSESR